MEMSQSLSLNWKTYLSQLILDRNFNINDTFFSYNQENLIFPMKSLAPMALFLYNIHENSYDIIRKKILVLNLYFI